MKQVKGKFGWKSLKIWIIRSFIFILCLEFGLMLASKAGLINCQQPTYSLDSNSQFLPKFDQSIGYMHQPNSSYMLKLSCTESIKYQFNLLGFLERNLEKKQSDPRIILIGDSFMEGYGVRPEKRLSNKLEKITNFQIANFGLSDKGTVHFLKIYEKFAPQYDHKAVLIALFPTNDFYDDYSQGAKNGSSPYWKKTTKSWQLIEPKIRLKDKKELSFLKQILKEFTYSYNVYLHLRSKDKTKNLTYFDHSNHSELQWERMKQSLQKIKELAKSKSIGIFTIPGKHELTNESFKSNALLSKLKNFCDSVDIEYIPLAESIFDLEMQEREDLYNACEIHWSDKGHEFASQIVRKHWSIFKSDKK